MQGAAPQHQRKSPPPWWDLWWHMKSLSVMGQNRKCNDSSTLSPYHLVPAVLNVVVGVRKWKLVALDFKVIYHCGQVQLSLTRKTISSVVQKHWIFHTICCFHTSLYNKISKCISLIDGMWAPNECEIWTYPWGKTCILITANLTTSACKPCYPSTHSFINATVSSSDLFLLLKNWFGYASPTIAPWI